jgi:hypothetical protein
MSGFAKRCQVTQRKGVHGIAMKTPSIRDILMPIDFSPMLAGLHEH